MEPNLLIDKVKAVIESFLEEESSYFIVQIKIKPSNNIKVFLDGDQGLPIEKCTFFNRKLYKAIEEEAWFPEGDFSLEVSSPGVDEPLLLKRQYNKNVGRKVQVTLLDGVVKEGILLTVAEADILIEWTEGKGKKAVQQQLLIPFENIKSTIVQIQF
ncbi:MAG: ribosome maturation factor [Chitinophagia bacterium]|jgi:ribosome maturation factor RimP|nr:ribosome maturation factor [Chitinophagia bacterium]